jgi:WD40 repeat protein
MTLKGHWHAVMCIAVSKTKIFTGAWDRTIKQWEIQSGQNTGDYKGHWGYISCLVLVDDILYSGSSDATIRSWDTSVRFSSIGDSTWST